MEYDALPTELDDAELEELIKPYLSKAQRAVWLKTLPFSLSPTLKAFGIPVTEKIKELERAGVEKNYVGILSGSNHFIG